jgi:hypothetical protein
VEARVSRDSFVRVGGVDYSVPPGRRLGICVGLERVIVHLEGMQIAEHARSYVPADVVLAAEHVRALRLARSSKRRLEAGDVAIPEVDPARYDVLSGGLQ